MINLSPLICLERVVTVEPETIQKVLPWFFLFFYFSFHKLYGVFNVKLFWQVFICEQKLYTKAQLDQHIKTGDSEVDGSETERGGFMGHPICQFCDMPYYGENELYSHMQTGHYMCHICQK